MYNSLGSCFGGYLKDYPNWENNLRSIMFPEYKRKVKISVRTWVDEDPDATHYYVSFNVEADPILIAEDDGFREITTWDFPKEYNSHRIDWSEAIPYSKIESKEAFEEIKKGFTDAKYTLDFAKSIVENDFPENKYKIIWDVDVLIDAIGRINEG